MRRIVYLGGLVPRDWPPTRHLASRRGVEQVLLAAAPDSLALRASIVIAARSRSFRLLVRLVERLPLLTLPPWRRFRTQPIDGRDLVAMLTRAADAAPVDGRVIDVAGPEVLSYEEMLERIAEIMLIKRRALRLRIPGTGAERACRRGDRERGPRADGFTHGGAARRSPPFRLRRAHRGGLRCATALLRRRRRARLARMGGGRAARGSLAREDPT